MNIYMVCLCVLHVAMGKMVGWVVAYLRININQGRNTRLVIDNNNNKKLSPA
jgi:hypothetical protein